MYHGRLSVQERAVELTSDFTKIDARIQQVTDETAKVLELATKAATATDVKAVIDAMDTLKTSIPNRDEMEKVVKQITDLKENGLSALGDVDSLKSDLVSLQDRVEKVESLSSSFEDLKTDAMKTQTDVKALQSSIEDSTKELVGVEGRLSALEANTKTLDEVHAKV